MSKTELSKPDTGLSLMGGLTAEDLKSLDVEKVEALLGMQERIDARSAERALADALAKFQESAPRVHKSKKGGHGTYAGFDDVMGAVQKHLAENGLSVSFDTEGGDGSLTATCHVMHRDGARFSRKATVPVASGGGANAAQQMGSAISYAKRYAMTAALNIVTTDEDDDGAAAGAQGITQAEADKVRELVDQVTDAEQIKKFWAWRGCKTPEEIPAGKLKSTLDALGRIIAKQGGRSESAL